MNLIPAKLGASSKQVKVLGVLGLILVGVLVYNFTSSSTPVPMTTARTPLASDPVPLKAMPTAPASLPPRTSRKQNTRVEDFRPSLKLKEGTDVSKIDPTLRLELLAKLKDAEMKGGVRSLFAFGAAPAPDMTLNPGLMKRPVIGPMPPPPPVDPAKLAQEKKDREEKNLPPIPLKFYGYSAKGGTKRAFFLDGDDIQVAGENELIKNRYKVIRIGVNSVVVEDTQNKHEQTLPLIEELAG
jgi:hypothetical protein